MTIEIPPSVLKGAKALVVGVANQHSIAYGCAKAFRELGADLAITYVNEKTKTYVEPLAKELGAPIFMPLDVAAPGMLEAVFDRITQEWGQPRHPCPLARLGAEAGLAGASSSIVRRGFQAGDGHLLPFVRAHGAAGGSPDEERRLHVRDELSRSQQGRAELQRDGSL
jgi:NAD(P)-dependent dehydrogenase (short-subunit alcohol dehydrogenase family)